MPIQTVSLPSQLFFRILLWPPVQFYQFLYLINFCFLRPFFFIFCFCFTLKLFTTISLPRKRISYLTTNSIINSELSIRTSFDSQCSYVLFLLFFFVVFFLWESNQQFHIIVTSCLFVLTYSFSYIPYPRNYWDRGRGAVTSTAALNLCSRQHVYYMNQFSFIYLCGCILIYNQFLIFFLLLFSFFVSFSF